jgi:MFS family permease
VTVGLANGAFWSLGPVYAQRTGLDVTGVAVFMSATVLAGAVGQWPLGRASDRYDRRNVIAIACTGAAVAAAALASGLLTTQAQIMVAGCAFGIFAFPVYAIAVAHTNDHVPHGEFVESSSGLLLLFGAGAVVGPLVASIAMNWIGSQGLYVFTALVHMTMASFALYRMHRRERVSADERTTFIHGLEVANTVSNIFEDDESEQASEAGPVSVAAPEDGPPAPQDKDQI